jgi:hypothetical protein
MPNDQLADMLAEGWEIEGYSTTLMAAGAMTHAILLRSGDQLVSCTVVAMGDKELGRNFILLSPKLQPAQQKGLFRR